MKKLISISLFTILFLSIFNVSEAQIRIPKIPRNPKIPKTPIPRVPPIQNFTDVTGVYRGERGIYIYMKKIGYNEVYGLIEWDYAAVVFKGKIEKRGDNEVIVNQYFPVPKGNSINSTEGYRVSIGNIYIKNSGRTVAFTHTFESFRQNYELNKTTSRSFYPSKDDSGFTGPSGAGFTGTWECNDGGRYYMYQKSGTRGDEPNLVWFGESANTRTPGFTNIFVGKVRRTTTPPDEFGQRRSVYEIKGKYVDIPKGRASGKGELTLRGDWWNLGRTAVVGGFGGSTWRKNRDLEVNIQRLEAISPDACGSMDFFGYTTIGADRKNYGVSEGNDIRPNWKHRAKWEYDRYGMVNISIVLKDDDDFGCGGGDDKVDINPQPGSDDNIRALGLFLAIDSQGHIYQKKLDGTRGDKIGRVGQAIEMRGNSCSTAWNDPSSGNSDEECAKITFKIDYVFE